MLAHLTALVVVPGCLALGWWQLNRALSGNTLSWVYTFEWPFFAGYAVFVWWRIVHTEPVQHAAAPGQPREARRGGDAGKPPRPEHDDLAREEQREEEDAELAAYNRYLAQLAEQDEAAGR